MRFALSLFAWLLPLVPAIAAPNEVLFGKWQGTLSQDMGTVGVTLSVHGDGFAMDVSSPIVDLDSVQFLPAGNAGVYEQVEQTGVMSWLIFQDSGSTLEGEPLSWARTDEQGSVIIYRFALSSEGKFRLFRLALAESEGEVVLELSRLDGPERPEPLRALMEPQ